jgi:hypothetical protein
MCSPNINDNYEFFFARPFVSELHARIGIDGVSKYYEALKMRLLLRSYSIRVWSLK